MRRILAALVALLVAHDAIAAGAYGNSGALGSLTISGTGGTLQCPYPTSPAPSAGDTLLLDVAMDDIDRGSIATPNGYTTLKALTHNTTYALSAGVTAAGGETGNLAVTITGSSNGVLAFCKIHRYTGTTLTVHVSGITGENYTHLNVPVTALTITHANTIVHAFGLSGWGNGSVTPAAFTAPTSFTKRTQDPASSTLSFVAGDWIQTTATNVSAGFWTSTDDASFCSMYGCGSFGVTVSLEAAVATGGFLSGPTCAKLNTTTLRCTYSATNGNTVRGELLPTGSASPTGAAIAAGTGAHGTASLATNGSVQTLDLTTTDGTPFPMMDPYLVVDLGSGSFSSVSATQTVCFDPPTGFQFTNCPTGLTAVNVTGSLPALINAKVVKLVGYSGLSGTFHAGDVLTDNTSGAWGFLRNVGSSPLTVDRRSSAVFANGDAIVDQQGGSATVSGAETTFTAVVIGDVLVMPTTVTPLGAAVTQTDTAGSFKFVGAGKQLLAGTSIYRRGTSGAGGYATLPIDAYISNGQPGCQTTLAQQVFKLNVAITTLDLNGGCADPDTETLHYGRIAGVMPAGLALSTSGQLTGTPTVQNLSGVTLSVVLYDGASDWAAQGVPIYPVNLWNVGNYVGLTQGVADSQIKNAYFDSVKTNIVPIYNAATPGNVVSQSPAAAGTIAPQGTITLNVSQGLQPTQGKHSRGGVRLHGLRVN